MTYAIFTTSDEAYANLPNTPNGGDVARAKAQNNLAARIESEQRSDTDGFVSQYCFSLNRSKELAEAQIADHGGMAVFRVLVDATTNELVSTKLYELFNHFAGFGFVDKWRVVRDGKVEWVTDYKRPGNFTKKGLKVAWMIAPAYATLASVGEFSQREEGRGFSGLSSVFVSVRMKRKEAGINI